MNLAISSVVAAVCALTSGCAHRLAVRSDFDPSVPELGYLRARVDTLYQALRRADWRTWYLMASPEFRRESSYQEFLREISSQFEEIEAMSWRIRSIARMDDSDLPSGGPFAKVGMELRVETVRNPRRRSDHTDYWLYLDGEWYWVWADD